MGKFKIEKMGYVFYMEAIRGDVALVLLKEKHPNHEVFKDCKDGVFIGFFISKS